MFGSMIFGMWEKWDALDGAYFCFISLSRYVNNYMFFTSMVFYAPIAPDLFKKTY